MDNMKTFVLWFLEQLPSFLLSEPMCYFVGFAFLVVTIRIIRDIIRF